MLLLDDGTHFTKFTTAATKSVKASRPTFMNWMHRAHFPVQPTQVFLDSVVQQVVPWWFVRRQPVRRQTVRQQPVQQPVQQRSFLEAISSQLSALPPPAVKRMIPSLGNL